MHLFQNWKCIKKEFPKPQIMHIFKRFYAKWYHDGTMTAWQMHLGNDKAENVKSRTFKHQLVKSRTPSEAREISIEQRVNKEKNNNWTTSEQRENHRRPKSDQWENGKIEGRYCCNLDKTKTAKQYCDSLTGHGQHRLKQSRRLKPQRIRNDASGCCHCATYRSPTLWQLKRYQKPTPGAFRIMCHLKGSRTVPPIATAYRKESRRRQYAKVL